jgi:hypothetical protein
LNDDIVPEQYNIVPLNNLFNGSKLDRRPIAGIMPPGMLMAHQLLNPALIDILRT